MGWLLPAVFRGLLIINKQKVDLIYSTSPAETGHLIALLLKLVTRKPWVADFRDPWMLRYKPNQKNKIIMKIENWLECQVMKNADKIILNTELLKNEYVMKYADIITNKSNVITNGYDSADFDNIHAKKDPKGTFTISHVGEFYEGTRTPDNFLKAIGELISENKVAENELRINFVGGGDYVSSNQFEELVTQLRLKRIVSIFPHIPHRESIEFMLNSDILLLLQPDEKYKQQIPAKAFEYIKSGNYIFTLAPNGATANLVSAIQGDGVVDPFQIDVIKSKIYELYLKFKNNELRKNVKSSKIDSYDRRKLTKDLAEIFHGLLDE